jgi:hypothetical protein
MFKGVIACSLTVLLSTGLLLAHGNATHFKGTVSEVDAAHNTFTVKQTDGKLQKIMTDKFTKYLKNEKPTPSSDLKVGVRVVVDAKMDNTAKMYVAEEVAIGAAQTASTAKPAAPASPAKK